MPDDEAVRIFLEFERVESAIKGQCLPAVPTLQFYGTVSFATPPHDYVTALIMWVKVHPHLNELAQIQNKVSLGSLWGYITNVAQQPSRVPSAPREPGLHHNSQKAGHAQLMGRAIGSIESNEKQCITA